MGTPASTDEFSFWDVLWELWRGPRIVEVNASEHSERRVAPGGCTQWTGVEVNDLQHPRRGIALSARWKNASIGGTTLEVYDSTSIVRTLHVDPAWRRRGVARRLLRSLLRLAHFYANDVYVPATAADAGFYALHGFRPVDDQRDSRGPADRLVSSVLNECISDERDVVVMRRRLPSGFVSTPYDSITVDV